ncbi:MAG: PIN domain-containing protein [Deltaproteobacteria bacterium]|nr:PIN domain-containing protein [Deltaproteobacteria bacterium]
MSILVDTSVWSLALRRNQLDSSPHVQELVKLIKNMQVQVIGPIRQEILSGIKTETQFVMVREQLRPFPDLPLTADDFEYAAELFNILRARGIQGSNTDFLICAVSLRHSMPIFTTDNDFTLFALHIPIKLHAMNLG